MYESDCSRSSSSSWCSLPDDDQTSTMEDHLLGHNNETSTRTQQQHGGIEIDEQMLPNKFIIHLDIDCFYCQCEEILNPSLATKPLAIDQKHIIVTINNMARKLGIKKLMGRRDALNVCPTLAIIEGSDLEKYRKVSQQVYSEFRNAVKEFGHENMQRRKEGSKTTTSTNEHNNMFNTHERSKRRKKLLFVHQVGAGADILFYVPLVEVLVRVWEKT